MRQELAYQAEKGLKLYCQPFRRNGQIVAWDYPFDGIILRVGPLLHPWIPHEPNTWPHHYMTAKVPVTLRIWNGHGKDDTERVLPIGTRVKIVMCSRLGDVGITDDLTAGLGYHARILITELEEKFENFSMDP